MKSLVLLLFLVEVLSCCHARDRLFTMRFTREILAPDGVNASVITINNIFPGPTLRVNIGDRLVVNVSNYLGTGEMLSLHWHGISQRGSPWNDGAAAVTNCAISYGREHTYSFITEESGTFWYHLHNGVERGEGGYGFLIVEEPEVVASYDEERLLVLADWFRVSSDEINSRLNAFGQRGAQYWPGSGDSLLVNGKGQQHVFVDVQPNKMYRFRVLNAGSLAYLNLAIAAHDLTIITSGSTLIRPVSMKSLDVAVAQRFDFLLHTDQQPLSYNIRIYSQYQGNDTTAAGVFDSIFLRYNNASEVSPIQPSNEIKAWNDQITKLLPRDDLSVYEAPAVLEKYPRLKQLSRTTSLPKPTKFIILNVTEQFTDARSGQNLRDATSKNGFYRWTINGMSHNQASTPLLLASYYDVLDRVYSNGMMKPYRLEYGDVVQLVIQNQAKETGECDVHTWHLHGYDFWILGYGEGTFDPRVHEETLNTINPFTSDSVLSFPTNFTMLRGREYPEFDRDNGIKSCGWTVIRFVADNPGMWHFHCHLDWDMALGMGLVFDVASELLWENMTLTLPYNHELCGLIDRNTINPRLEKKLANEECINYCNSEKVHNRHQDLRLILSHLIVVLFGIACGFLWNRKCFAQKPIKNSSYEIEMYSTTSRGNWLPFSRGFQRLNSDSVHEKDPTINTIHDTQDQQENNHAS